MRSDIDEKFKFYKLKKSMLVSYIIEFEFVNDAEGKGNGDGDRVNINR